MVRENEERASANLRNALSQYLDGSSAESSWPLPWTACGSRWWWRRKCSPDIFFPPNGGQPGKPVTDSSSTGNAGGIQFTLEAEPRSEHSASPGPSFGMSVQWRTLDQTVRDGAAPHTLSDGQDAPSWTCATTTIATTCSPTHCLRCPVL